MPLRFRHLLKFSLIPALALLALGLLTAPPSQAALTIAPGAIIAPFPTGVPLFAPSSPWNAPLPAGAPLSPQSSTLSAALAGEVAKETTANNGPWINTDQNSVPVYTVGSAVPLVHVTLDTWNPSLQMAFNAVPIPWLAHAAAGWDQQLVIYQPSSDTLWEFWLMHPVAGLWHARWGGMMTHVSQNPGYFTGSYGASGTSLGLLGGLMTMNELETGLINHALAIAVPNTAAGTYVWPAQRSDGKTTGPTAIPEGTHFRIDPSLNLTTLHLSPVALIMARAAQRYGMIVRDTAGVVAFYGEDPTTIITNPYPAIFGGQYPNVLLKGFPWNRLQVVAPTPKG